MQLKLPKLNVTNYKDFKDHTILNQEKEVIFVDLTKEDKLILSEKQLEDWAILDPLDGIYSKYDKIN